MLIALSDKNKEIVNNIGLLPPPDPQGIRVASVIEFSVCVSVCLFVCS